MIFEIYYNDLSMEAQMGLCAAFDTSYVKENWDTQPLAIIERFMVEDISDRFIQSLLKSAHEMDTRVNWEMALHPEICTENVEAYNRLAKVIVEPNYFEGGEELFWKSWIEDSSDGWFNFIKNTLGDKWGALAQTVIRYGY